MMTVQIQQQALLLTLTIAVCFLSMNNNNPRRIKSSSSSSLVVLGFSSFSSLPSPTAIAPSTSQYPSSSLSVPFFLLPVRQHHADGGEDEKEKKEKDSIVLNAGKNKRNSVSNNNNITIRRRIFRQPQRSINRRNIKKTFHNSPSTGLLLLTNKKRQEELKQDIHHHYPFVPAGLVDRAVDSVVEAFTTLAPKQVQEVLQPGVFTQQIRPELEQTMIDTILRTFHNNRNRKDSRTNLPFQFVSTKDQTKMVRTMVSMGFDYLLHDAEYALQDPIAQIRLLDVQKHQLQHYLTWYELNCNYRLRYYSIQMTLLGLTTMCSLAVLYQHVVQSGVVSSFLGSIVHHTRQRWIIPTIGGTTGMVIRTYQHWKTNVCHSIQTVGTTMTKRLQSLRSISLFIQKIGRKCGSSSMQYSKRYYRQTMQRLSRRRRVR